MIRGRGKSLSAALVVLAFVLVACGADDDLSAESDAPDDTDESAEAVGGDDDGVESGESADIDVSAIDPVTVNVTTLHPDGNWQATPWRAFGEAVTDVSGDQIDFEYNWAGSLLPSAETVTGLESGIADVGYPVFATTPEQFPIDTWISRLGFLADEAPVVGALQAYAATLEWGFENQDFLDELERNGLAPLLPRIQMIPEYHLICIKPVVSEDDFQGLRVRTGGPAWADAAESLGMSTVTVATAEIFETLQRGVVECSMNGFADFIGLGLWDVADHATSTSFAGWSSYSVSMGKPFYDSLSTDAQQAIWTSLDAYIETMLDNSLTEQHRFVVEGAERGMTFHELDADAASAVEAYHEGVLADIVDEAPPEASDPEAMVDSLVELHEKWQDIAIEMGYMPEEDNYFDWAQAQPEGHQVDVGPFVERIMEEILLPRMPG